MLNMGFSQAGGKEAQSTPERVRWTIAEVLYRLDADWHALSC
jgi:hypothetical protein